MGFRGQLESALRTPQGKRVFDEALRLARDPVSKKRILDLRHRVAATTTSRSGQRPQS